MSYRELKPEDLAWRLDESVFKFNTTNELEGPVGAVGQERALNALDFGLGIKSFGYNLYVMGQTGTGRMSTVNRVLEKKSREVPGPLDWLYVMDFEKPDRPKIVNLPRGKGCEFEVDMDNLIEQLKKAIPKAFEGEEFEKRRENLLTEHNARTTELFEGLEQTAKERGFSLEKSPRGLVLVPVKENGSLMSQEEFEAQEAAVKDDIEERGSKLQDQLSEAMRKVRDLEKALQEVNPTAAMTELSAAVVLSFCAWVCDMISSMCKNEVACRKFNLTIWGNTTLIFWHRLATSYPIQMPMRRAECHRFDDRPESFVIKG